MEERLNRVKQQLQQSSYKLTPQRGSHSTSSN